MLKEIINPNSCKCLVRNWEKDTFVSVMYNFHYVIMDKTNIWGATNRQTFVGLLVASVSSTLKVNSCSHPPPHPHPRSSIQFLRVYKCPPWTSLYNGVICIYKGDWVPLTGEDGFTSGNYDAVCGGDNHGLSCKGCSKDHYSTRLLGMLSEESETEADLWNTGMVSEVFLSSFLFFFM